MKYVAIVAVAVLAMVALLEFSSGEWQLPTVPASASGPATEEDTAWRKVPAPIINGHEVADTSRQRATLHLQRLAALRQKQEGVMMAIQIERETINKILREDGIQAIPETEHERVERLIQEKASIDAAIEEEEQIGGPEPPQPTVLQTLSHHRIGETFSIGYWTYRCYAVRWSEMLGNGSSGMGRPDAEFAVIYLMMRNDDDGASTLPPLTLLDSDAKEYKPSPKAVLQRDALNLGMLELDAKASISGSVIFDVPHGRPYYLKVSGGYWSANDALIDIDEQ